MSITAVSVLYSGSVNSEPVLRYGMNAQGGWVPWDNTGIKARPGIFPELIPLILNTAKIAGEPVTFPTKRAIKALEDGLLDFDFVSPDWFSDGDIGEQFIASVPILTIKEYFITLPAQQAQFDTPEKVYGNVVGTIAGYYYFDDSQFIRMDFDAESRLVSGLHRQRFKVAILEEMTAWYWSGRLDLPVALSAVHTEGELVMRIRKEHLPLLAKINQAILLLQDSGEIEKLLMSYRALAKRK